MIPIPAPANSTLSFGPSSQKGAAPRSTSGGAGGRRLDGALVGVIYTSVADGP